MNNTINVNEMTSYYSNFIKSVTAKTSVNNGSKINNGTMNGEKDSFISTLRCNEIKAVNNKVVLDNKHYYGYQDKRGNKHVFACLNNRLEQPYSDLISGRQNNDSFQICKFWNLLSKDGTYLSLYYSQEQQRQMLNDAGITEGFFSVQIGDRKQDYFYSNGMLEWQ